MARPAHPHAMAPHKPGRTRTAPPQMPATWWGAQRILTYLLFDATGIVYFLVSFLAIGLVQALDSVGKNLFGSAAFGVSAVPGNPVFPAGNVQIDLASDSRISTAIGVFIPGNPVVGNPCRRIAQLELRPPSVASDEPGLVLAYDPQYAPPLVVARTLGSSVPNVARCPSATTF